MIKEQIWIQQDYKSMERTVSLIGGSWVDGGCEDRRYKIKFEQFEILQQGMKEYSKSVTMQPFRNSIDVSTHKLYELINHHQNFTKAVKNLNNHATLHIEQDHPKQALIHLQQAQQILQYAASCGKNIDRQLILSVLQNQACSYQKLWEHDKCSNYLEALIYNLSQQLQSVQSSQNQSILKTHHQKESVSELSTNILEGKPIHQRVQLCRYQLQYCAINSQTRNHKKALGAGKNVLTIMKKVFRQLRKINKQMNYHLLEVDEDLEEIQAKAKIINGISEIENEVNAGKVEDYIATASYYFWKWNIRKLQQRNQQIKQTLKAFSIGSIMQIKPKLFDCVKDNSIHSFSFEDHSELNQFKVWTYSRILQNVLLLSVSYFSIATQLRLIANEKYKKSEQLKHDSQQYRQSQIYHLISLIIACIYVPFDMMYIRHILSSFTNHYNIDISIDGNFYSNSPSVMKQIFDKEMFAESNKNTFSNSIKKKQDNFLINLPNALKESEKSVERKRTQYEKNFIHKRSKSKNKNSSKKSNSKKHKKVSSSVSQDTLKKEKRSPAHNEPGKKGSMKSMKLRVQQGKERGEEYYINSHALIKQRLQHVISEKQNKRKRNKSNSKSKAKLKKGKNVISSKNIQTKEKKECLVKNIDKYYF